MGRTYGYNAAAKVPTSSGTTVFSPSEIANEKVVAFFITLVGTALTWANVSRVRVKYSGQTGIDILGTQLTAFNQRFGRSNVGPLSTGTQGLIPLNIPDAKGDERDSCATKPGAAISVEIVFGSITTSATDAVTIGWAQTDVKQAWYPMLLGQPKNFAASVNNNRFPITQPGLIRGVVNSSAASIVDRQRLVLSGNQIWNMSRAQMLVMQQNENMNTYVTHYAYKVDPPMPAAIGTSFIEEDNGASGAVSDEVAIWSLNPV